jgi:hypothetical protein
VGEVDSAASFAYKTPGLRRILAEGFVTAFVKAFAVEGLAALALAPESRQVCGYWLSLWEGDALPLRARFEPLRVREFLPGIMVMEVKPGERVRVRLSGSAVNAAVGMDLTGQDLLALTRDGDRRERLKRNTNSANGQAGWSLRSGQRADGTAWRAEEIYLPFRDTTEDGARLILYHTTMRPGPDGRPVIDLTSGLSLSEDFRFIPLGREA